MTKFAIIGTGDIARIHLAAIRSIGGCEVVAAYDPKEEWAKIFAMNAKCRYYTDYDALLKEDIDVIDIVNENYLHADLASRALEAGKHVLLEKPIDSDIEKAKKLVEMSKTKKGKLGIILQHRYDTAFMELKEIVESNRLGHPISAAVKIRWYRGDDYYQRPWRNDLKMSGGGVVMQQGLHFMDLLTWILGEIESVYAKTESTRKYLMVEDHADGIIKFRNGCNASFEFSTALPTEKDVFEVIGSKGSYRILGREVTGQGLWKRLKSRFFYRYGSHKELMFDFLKSINSSKDYHVSGEEGLKSLDIVQAIYESARTGKEVVFIR